MLALVLCGCAQMENFRYRKERKRYARNLYPANHFQGLRTVGVVVVDASYQYEIDTRAFSSALHTQLQSIEGLQVIPDVVVLAELERNVYALPADGLRLNAALGLDGTFVALMTDYQPYGEPVLALSLTLFSSAIRTDAPFDLAKEVQAGVEFPMPGSPSQMPVAGVFAVYDASRQDTRRRIKWFAEGATAREVGLSWERYYRSMPNYMRFVSYEIVWRLFEEYSSVPIELNERRD